jgi:hypothetical protein
MGVFLKTENDNIPGEIHGHGSAREGRAVPPGSPQLNLGYLGKGFPALQDIRDNILLLSLANDYLCENVFLDNRGKAIESQLDSVREEIAALKVRFPGRFVTEIDTDSLIRELQAYSRRLQKPDKELINECAAGSMGRAMEKTMNALTVAVKSIKRKVEGEAPTYTAKDSVLGVIDKAKTPVSMAKRAVLRAVKTVLVLVILSFGPLIYLLLTMDRESALLKEIGESEAIIQSRKEAVVSIEREKEAMRQGMEVVKTDDAPREAKFEIMEINVKMHSLDQSRNRAEAEISSHEERIRINKQKLEAVKEKPFLDRLFRKKNR